MTYQEECQKVMKVYNEKYELLLKKYANELRKLGADGKFTTESNKISKECNQKIKELKIKYNME